MVQDDEEGAIRRPKQVPGLIDVFKPAVDVLGVRDTNTVTEEDIRCVELYLVDETKSPVGVIDRATALDRFKEFVNSEEVKEAETAGGISKIEYAKIYQQILDWLKAKNICDMEVDYPSFDATVYTQMEGLTNTYFSRDDADTNHKRTNLLARFIRENSIDVKKGDLDKNIFAIVIMYDRVKDLALA